MTFLQKFGMHHAIKGLVEVEISWASKITVTNPYVNI